MSLGRITSFCLGPWSSLAPEDGNCVLTLIQSTYLAEIVHLLKHFSASKLFMGTLSIVPFLVQLSSLVSGPSGVLLISCWMQTTPA